MLHLMCSQKVSNNGKYVMLRKWLLKRGRDLILCYVYKLCIYSTFKNNSECSWKGECSGSWHCFESACVNYESHLKFLSKWFTPPYECIRKIIKKPPDRLTQSLVTFLYITLFYSLYALIRIVKICHLTCLRTLSIFALIQK